MTYIYDQTKAETTANYPLLGNPRKYYYEQRLGRILFGCVHITAGIDDFDGNDGSAEAAIRYGMECTRPASWTVIVDSDTIADCLPDRAVAFAQGVYGVPYSYNTHGLGIEIGARTTNWNEKPKDWVEKTLRNLAKAFAPRHKRYGWKLKHVSLSELQDDLRNGRPSGYIGHAELTRETRSDPGWVGNTDTFPWAQFLRYLAEELGMIESNPKILAEQKQLNAELAGWPSYRPIAEDGIDGDETQEARKFYMATLEGLQAQIKDLQETVDKILDKARREGWTGEKRIPLGDEKVSPATALQVLLQRTEPKDEEV